MWNEMTLKQLGLEKDLKEIKKTECKWRNKTGDTKKNQLWVDVAWNDCAFREWKCSNLVMLTNIFMEIDMNIFWGLSSIGFKIF